MSQEEIVVPKGWKNIKVSDIVESRLQGLFHSEGYKPEGIPLLRITDLDDNGNIKYDNIPKIETSQKNIDRFQLKKGDIVIARTGGAGRSAIVSRENHPLLFAGYLIRFRFKQEVLPQFMSYFLRSGKAQNQFFSSIHGTGNKNINAQNVLNLDILLPPLSIQKQIIQKLDHILVELEVKKKEILSLIEQNKERIDFFEKNWKSYVIDREIEKHPQRKEWELKKLSEVCQYISSGGTPNRSNSEYYGGSIPWLKIGDLNNGIISDSNEKITKEGLEHSSAKLFPINTILFAMYGATIGKTGILEKPCTTNQAICGMVCDNKIIPNFLLYLLQSKYHEIRKMAEGGAQPNINQNKLKNFEIPLPPIPIQKQIIQNIKNAEVKFKEQKKQFKNIKNNY